MGPLYGLYLPVYSVELIGSCGLAPPCYKLVCIFSNNQNFHLSPDPLCKCYACIAGKRPVAVAEKEAPEENHPITASHTIKFPPTQIGHSNERVIPNGKKQKGNWLASFEEPSNKSSRFYLALIILYILNRFNSQPVPLRPIVKSDGQHAGKKRYKHHNNAAPQYAAGINHIRI